MQDERVPYVVRESLRFRQVDAVQVQQLVVTHLLLPQVALVRGLALVVEYEAGIKHEVALVKGQFASTLLENLALAERSVEVYVFERVHLCRTILYSKIHSCQTELRFVFIYSRGKVAKWHDYI